MNIKTHYRSVASDGCGNHDYNNGCMKHNLSQLRSQGRSVVKVWCVLRKYRRFSRL